jgi:hypothetical protein
MRFTKRSEAGRSRLAPVTTFVFTTCGRSAIAKRSYQSLESAVKPVRDSVRIIVSDATDDIEKITWLKDAGADDIVWTPRGVSAATSRNIALTLMLDKYASEYVCFLEDDYEYSEEWYPALLETCKKNYGQVSPWGLAYGMFSASRHNLEKERVRTDDERGLTAYLFGAVADQRFMPTHHYLAVARMWDPDILGISYCQTGMQTSRNVMRGFCGGILPQEGLCRPIPEHKSTWRKTKRDVGPPAHDMDVRKFRVVCEAAQSAGRFDPQKGKDGTRS